MSAAIAREYEALIPILERMGVPRHGVLVVHSAIATLSRQGLRAEGMIEAFLDYMRDGTVVMPTMTWRTVTPQQPMWDELTTPSHTGVLSEVFRTRYATDRSIHPTHSVAAYGPQARRLVARHHLDDTPVSANSPYGLMRETPAYILLLGVGLEILHRDPPPRGGDRAGHLRAALRADRAIRMPRPQRRHASGPHAPALAAQPRLSQVRCPPRAGRRHEFRKSRRLPLRRGCACRPPRCGLRSLSRRSARNLARSLFRLDRELKVASSTWF